MGLSKKSGERESRKRYVLFAWIRFIARYGKSFKAVKHIKDIRNRLALSNIHIAKLDPSSTDYLNFCNAFDYAMLHLNAAKHHTAELMKNNSKAGQKQANNRLQDSSRIVDAIEEAFLHTAPLPEYRPPVYTKAEAEILFFEGMPVIPEINPVIVLKGTDFEMGYQYAQQVIEIFGKWILEMKAGQAFDESAMNCLRLWEEQLQIHAPEILEICRGWAAGAADTGIAMTYYDVLDIWTGHTPPAVEYYGAEDGPPKSINPPACSGLAAWGKATADGKLVAAASGDHDASFTATIVAFPNTGNSFIYTPFSVVGQLPNIGPVYMMGHPGMNSKGVAYVHHGGAPKMIEAKEHWGYGVRLGASVFHNLRFANTAKEALSMDMAYPIGDVGERSGVGTAGGFYADSSYGYVAESRRDPLIVREAGMAEDTDFLYANNSVIHREALQAQWLKNYSDNWSWEAHSGWQPNSMKNLQGAKNAGMQSQIQSAMSYVYLTSYGRNEYAYRMLHLGSGKIDMEYMKMLYRNSGNAPKGNWEEITRAYNTTGKWDGTYSVGHASNALVAVMKPDNGNEGIYSLCVGTAKRGVAPISPTMCTPIYHETNAFFELKLDKSPRDMAKAAECKAEDYQAQAAAILTERDIADDCHIRQWLDLSVRERNEGVSLLACTDKLQEEKALPLLAKAIRMFTKAQVHALQLVQALIVPCSRPEDFGCR